MPNNLDQATEEIGMFCRQYLHAKKDLPIRSSEMGLLIYLSKQEEEVTPLKVSQFFQIAKPTVTAMINVLVDKKYMVKIQSSVDRRSYRISLTKKGRELVESTGRSYYRQIEILEEKMGDAAFHQLIQLIGQANEALREE